MTTVSVAVENARGLFFHPKGNARGKATIGLVLGLVGNTRPSLGTSSMFRFTQ